MKFHFSVFFEILKIENQNHEPFNQKKYALNIPVNIPLSYTDNISFRLSINQQSIKIRRINIIDCRAKHILTS